MRLPRRGRSRASLILACRPRRCCLRFGPLRLSGLDKCLGAVGISRFARQHDEVAYLSCASSALVSRRRANPSPSALARLACLLACPSQALLAFWSLASLAVGLGEYFGAVGISRFARQHDGVAYLSRASLVFVSYRRAPRSPSTLARFACLLACRSGRNCLSFSLFSSLAVGLDKCKCLSAVVISRFARQHGGVAGLSNAPLEVASCRRRVRSTPSTSSRFGCCPRRRSWHFASLDSARRKFPAVFGSSSCGSQ